MTYYVTDINYVYIHNYMVINILNWVVNVSLKTANEKCENDANTEIWYTQAMSLFPDYH